MDRDRPFGLTCFVDDGNLGSQIKSRGFVKRVTPSEARGVRPPSNDEGTMMEFDDHN